MKVFAARWLVWVLLRTSRLSLLIAELAIAASGRLAARAKRLFPVAEIDGWAGRSVAAGGRHQVPNPWVRP